MSLRETVAVQAVTWTGISEPNDAAGAMAHMLAFSIEGFAALRVRGGEGERQLRVPRDQRTQLPPCIP